MRFLTDFWKTYIAMFFDLTTIENMFATPTYPPMAFLGFLEKAVLGPYEPSRILGIFENGLQNWFFEKLTPKTMSYGCFDPQNRIFTKFYAKGCPGHLR